MATMEGTGEEFSWPGFIVALIAIPAMRYLAQRKIAIAEKIGVARFAPTRWKP